MFTEVGSGGAVDRSARGEESWKGSFPYGHGGTYKWYHDGGG